jgi:S1-C subfamily serine protease
MSDLLDHELDEAAGPERPEICAADLKKYFYFIAAVAGLILIATWWYTESYAPDANSPALFASPDVLGGVTDKMADTIRGSATPPNVVNGRPPNQEQGQQPAGGTAGDIAPPGSTMPSAVTGAPLMQNLGLGGNRGDFAAVAMAVRNSVVNISTTGGQNQAGAAKKNASAVRFANPFSRRSNGSIGSGIIIRDDGFILSNYHIVRGAGGVVVTVFGDQGTQRYRAQIVKMDEVMDLVLLKIQPRSPLTAAILADSSRVRVADEVIAIGSPFGLDQTVSKGIVSALRKSLDIDGITHSNLIQTDAAINQGNSGGPLVASNGAVVGINTAIYTPTGAFSGIGFAIPSNQVRQFMQNEMGQPLTAARGFTVAAPGGSQGSTAPVIAADARLPGSHSDGRNARNCAACHQFRDAGGRPLALSVAQPTANTYRFTGPPSSLAMNIAAPDSATNTMPVAGFDVPGANFSVMGAGVMPIDAALAERLKHPRDKGVFISQVMPGSPAAKGGLEAGDIVLKIDGKRIWAPGQLAETIFKAGNGNTVRLMVMREREKKRVDLTVAMLSPQGMGAGNAARQPSAVMKPRAIPGEFNWRGINVENFVPVGLPERAGSAGMKGAEVDEVSNGSAAARAGMKARDVIIKINSRSVGSAERLDQAIREAKGQTSILLQVMRGGRELFVVLP